MITHHMQTADGIVPKRTPQEQAQSSALRKKRTEKPRKLSECPQGMSFSGGLIFFRRAHMIACDEDTAEAQTIRCCTSPPHWSHTQHIPTAPTAQPAYTTHSITICPRQNQPPRAAAATIPAACACSCAAVHRRTAPFTHQKKPPSRHRTICALKKPPGRHRSICTPRQPDN